MELDMIGHNKNVFSRTFPGLNIRSFKLRKKPQKGATWPLVVDLLLTSFKGRKLSTLKPCHTMEPISMNIGCCHMDMLRQRMTKWWMSPGCLHYMLLLWNPIFTKQKLEVLHLLPLYHSAPFPTSQWSTAWNRHSPHPSRRGRHAHDHLAVAWPWCHPWRQHWSWSARWSRRRRDSHSWCNSSTCPRDAKLPIEGSCPLGFFEGENPYEIFVWDTLS